MEPSAIALTLLVGVIAFLYSAAGQAGDTGYVAALVVAGLPAGDLKTTALLLNVAVASVGSVQFARAGHLRWSLLGPFVLGSVPLAALGGWWQLPARPFAVLVGVILLLSALRLLLSTRGGRRDEATKAPSTAVALTSGAAIGLIGGLSGTGGGVILSPLMLLRRWAPAHQVAAASVTFILFNSIAGLGGVLISQRHLPQGIGPLLAVVVLAGTLGSRLGSRSLSLKTLERWMAVLIALVGAKLLIG